MIRVREKKKGLTLLEVLIGLSFLTVLVVLGYSLVSQSSRSSRKKMDSLQALGAARRVSGYLNQKLKTSVQVLHPIPGQPEPSEYCLIKSEDGGLSQLYFNERGDFLTRSLSRDQRKPKILVRSPGNGMGVKNPGWYMKSEGILEFYVSYVRNSARQEEVVAIFDSFSLHH